MNYLTQALTSAGTTQLSHTLDTWSQKSATQFCIERQESLVEKI